MARQLQRYLQHPDMLFRRVRDEHGNLQLSQRAAAFHPGQGVYRSSYKNARRLAATETNIAYRTADHVRWQQLDFIVGIEVRLSNNHTCLGKDGKPHPFYDICDELKGKYPKDFKFTGWHPHCRCIATTILKTEAEMDADDEAILRGDEPADPDTSKNAVTELPDNFRGWMEANQDRIDRAKSLPYFLRDNQALINPTSQPATTAVEPPQLSIAERAAARHAARTQTEIDDIRTRWNRRQLENLREDYRNGNLIHFKEATSFKEIGDAITSKDFDEADRLIKRLQVSMKTRGETNAILDKLEKDIASIPAGDRAMAKALIAQARKELKQATFITPEYWKRWEECIEKVIAEDAAGAIKQIPGQPLVRTFKTRGDISEALTDIEKASGDKWFVNVSNGRVKILKETDPDCNGSTTRDGRIWLQKDRIDNVRSCLRKIGMGYSDLVTTDEADAMATLWHEITHNRHYGFESPGAKKSLSRSFMELANEWVARHTLPEFYQRLGVDGIGIPHKEFMKNRNSTGYNGMVTSFDHVIGHMNLDRNAIMTRIRKKLFRGGRYDKLEDGLAQALIDGGLSKSDGTLATIDEAKELMRLVEQTTGTKKQDINDWLSIKGFAKRKKKK